MLTNISFNINIVVICLLLGCAAQGPATGGPIDKIGPSLISVNPNNGFTEIIPEQKITLIFDELVDPLSIPSSINIKNEVDYNLKIKGRKVIISPLNRWENSNILRINISRRVRDYQNNMMIEPIQLLFSNGLDIPSGIIRGKIIDTNNKRLAEVGLYQWPIQDSLVFIQKVEVNKNGFFEFRGLNYGKYTIIALEGVITNIKSQINKKRYSVITSNYITLSKNNNIENIEMIMSESLEKMIITSIEMESQYSLLMTMNNNKKEIFVLDSLLSVGDSVAINLEKKNRLETYKVPEFSFILPQINDTLSPNLGSTFFENDKYILFFSEPVLLSKKAITITSDSLEVPLLFNYETSMSISINVPESLQQFKIIGSEIKDWSNNMFIDSIKIITINKKINQDKSIVGGNIFGMVKYNGDFPIKIEAENLISKSKYITKTVNNKFSILNLPAGLYTLWAFEGINNMNRDIYHSGNSEPYHRAAKFSFYPDTIDVRARWDVESININFEK